VIYISKIIFIEGLPGSGKTIYTKRLSEYLLSLGEEVESYNEGDLHPIDLAWCAILTETEYNELLNKHRKYKEQIIKHSAKRDIGYIVAYTLIRVEDDDVSFYSDYEPYEIYKSNDFEHFKNTHLTLWNTFIPQDKYYIFECIFLQNHINELILKFNLTIEEMIEYFKELYNQVQGEKTVYYIKQKKIDTTLKRIIEERRSNNPNYSDWIDLLAKYFEQTTYGKALGYIGAQGAYQYFVDRQNKELEIVKHLSNIKIFELEDDYDIVFEEIKKKTI
jgi:hypothetical protein